MNKALRLSSALLMVALVGCPELGPWSEPAPVTELNSTFLDRSSCMSRDGLSVYFDSNRPGGFGGADILISRRASRTEPWGAPVNLGSRVNTSADEQGATLSHDGRVLIFLSNRAGGFGGSDLYVSRRTDPEDDFGWGAPENLGSLVNTSEVEQAPHLQKRGEDGKHTLYFGRGTPPDILAARVNDDGEVLGAAAPLNELNTSSQDVGVSVSRNGLELVFHSDRPGGFGSFDLYVCTRASVHDPWSAPQNMGALINTAVGEFSADLSRDGRTLLFTAGLRPGGAGAADIWMSTRTLIGCGEDGEEDYEEVEDEDDE